MRRRPISRRQFLLRTGLAAATMASPLPRAVLGAPTRQKVILDVDLGIDDAFALLMAHYSPAIELVGITTLYGNSALATGTRNGLYIKERFGIPCGVHPGAASPLSEPNREVPTFVHGEDGLGDAEPAITTTLAASDVSAPEFIARTILDNPGEITVIAVGPFTNLMLARILEPEIVEAVGAVIVMGGAVGFEGERGNATTVGEANVINDPHAADAIFRYDWPLTMVGLDVTYTADGAFDGAYMQRLASKGGDAGTFLERINRFYMDFYQQSRGVHTSFQHDSIAVAYAVAPELFEVRRGKLRVITEGVAMGQTIFCPEGHHTFEDPGWAGLPVHDVCSKLDGPAFRELYYRTLVASAVR